MQTMNSVVAETSNAIDALNIYQLHFGVEDRRQRKRHHAARLLCVSDVLRDLRSVVDIMRGTPAHYHNGQRAMDILSRVLKRREDRVHVPYWMHVCYRNHVYPVEVRYSNAPFRDVDMRHVDALLLDRPYDKFGTHFSSRRPWSQQDYGWMQTEK